MDWGVLDIAEGFTTTIKPGHKLPAAVELPRLSVIDAVCIGKYVAIRKECASAEEPSSRTSLIVAQLPNGSVGVLNAAYSRTVVLTNDGRQASQTLNSSNVLHPIVATERSIA